MKSMILALTFLIAGQVYAQNIPECDDHGRAMTMDNDRVIHLKHSTANDYHDRAFVKGTLSKIYPDATGHSHVELTLVGASTDTIELVYNEGFGTAPEMHVGQEVIACGDYITSFENDGRYRPSPDGALIHWLHRATHGSHDSGYFIVDGQIVGL